MFYRAITVAIVVVVCLDRASAAEPTEKPSDLTKSTATPQDELLAQLKKYDHEKDSEESLKRIQEKLKAVSDEQLEKLLDSVERTSGSELCLTEMIRRGGAHWEKILKDRSAAKIARKQTANKDPDSFPGALAGAADSADVALLTALRRVQKKDDPLVILIEGKSEINCKLGYPPTIQANLTNLDAEKSLVGFTWGGDYRGGRMQKWRIQITDANGHVLPTSENFGGGGFLTGETLKYGESVPASLRVGDYVQIGKPGTYTMVVLHHTRFYIDTVPSVDGLICCRSLPIKLTVEPIKLEVTDAEQAQLAELIRKLPKEGSVKILGGAYDEKSTFVTKESSAGQLLKAEWKAVPELISAVNSDKLNPIQRAWALGILFGITDQNNPIDAKGVVGPFEYRHSGWVRYGGVSGGLSLGSSSMSVLAGEIDGTAQLEFAKVWKPWIEKGYIQVKKPKAEPSSQDSKPADEGVANPFK